MGSPYLCGMVRRHRVAGRHLTARTQVIVPMELLRLDHGTVLISQCLRYKMIPQDFPV